MRRLIALATLLLVLAGCTTPPAPTGPSPDIHTRTAGLHASVGPAPAPLSAGAEQIGLQVKFTLEGYKGTAPPTITVRSSTGAVYADHQQPGPDRAYHLNTNDRPQLVKDRLVYTWTLPDGRAVSGSFTYTNAMTHPELQWQYTETNSLVIYHVPTLEPEAGARLDAAVKRATDLIGLAPDPVRIAVYIVPDTEILADFERVLGANWSPTMTGFAYPGAIFMTGDLPTPELGVLIAHEVIHVRGSDFDLPLLTEGFPEYISMLEGARLAREEGYESDERADFLDDLIGLTEQVQLGGYGRITLDKLAAVEPFKRNAYTVGTVFMLFVRSRFGQAGVQRLFAGSMADPGGIQPVKELFGEPFAVVQREFNEYLAGGQAVQDALTVFDIPTGRR